MFWEKVCVLPFLFRARNRKRDDRAWFCVLSVKTRQTLFEIVSLNKKKGKKARAAQNLWGVEEDVQCACDAI